MKRPDRNTQRDGPFFRRVHYFPQITEISIAASRGSLATWTVSRAGGISLK
jgi:hypothetical protein